MSLNACIVGCKVITLIGSEATDVVYEGNLWMLMMIYKAIAGLGCKWNGIISTISVLYAPWQKKLMHLYIQLLTWSTERTLQIIAKHIVKKKIVEQNSIQDTQSFLLAQIIPSFLILLWYLYQNLLYAYIFFNIL